MPYTQWITYSHIVAQIGFLSTIFFGSILLFLTTFHVKSQFGTYQKFLILFPVLGIIFATIEVMIYPYIHTFNAGFVLFIGANPFNSSNDFQTVLMSLYTGVYSSTISSLTVLFIYRYWAIFDERKLKYFEDLKFFLWLLYCILLGLLWGYGCLSFTKLDDFTREYMREEMWEKYQLKTEELAGFSIVAYDNNDNIRWYNLLGTVNMTSILALQYTVVVYCGLQMYYKMEKKMTFFSPSLKTMQQQFFKTLVLQISTPTLTLFMPVIFLIYLPLLNLRVSIPTGAMLCAFTLYPAMDSIIILYIVSDYRIILKKFCTSFFQKLKIRCCDAEDQAYTDHNFIDNTII